MSERDKVIIEKLKVIESMILPYPNRASNYTTDLIDLINTPQKPQPDPSKLLEACEELVEVCSYLWDASDGSDSTLEKAIKQGHAAMVKLI